MQDHSDQHQGQPQGRKYNSGHEPLWCFLWEGTYEAELVNLYNLARLWASGPGEIGASV